MFGTPSPDAAARAPAGVTCPADVTRPSGGELAAALDRARAGVPLVEALQQLADRTSLDALARFVDGLVVAIERGTPLAEVLRVQAADVRGAGKRRLLEAGGRKEIAMTVTKRATSFFPRARSLATCLAEGKKDPAHEGPGE